MFYQNIVKLKGGDCVSFEKEKGCLDYFYIKKVEVSEYKNLASVLKLVLSDGQASMERAYSLHNIIPNFNLKDISIISRKLIIDHMKSNFLSPQMFPVTKFLLKSVRSPRQRYSEYLKEEQPKKKENEHSA